MSHSDSVYIVTSKPDAPGVYETAEQKRHQIFERELAEHQHEPGALNAQQPNEIRMNDKQVGGTRATDTAYSRGIDMGLPVGISIQIAAQPLGLNPNVVLSGAVNGPAPFRVEGPMKRCAVPPSCRGSLVNLALTVSGAVAGDRASLRRPLSGLVRVCRRSLFGIVQAWLLLLRLGMF